MPKIQKKTVFASLFAVVAALALASTTALGLVVHRIRQFDEANNCKVLAGMTPLDVVKAQAGLEREDFRQRPGQKPAENRKSNQF